MINSALRMLQNIAMPWSARERVVIDFSMCWCTIIITQKKGCYLYQKLIGRRKASLFVVSACAKWIQAGVWQPKNVGGGNPPRSTAYQV